MRLMASAASAVLALTFSPAMRAGHAQPVWAPYGAPPSAAAAAGGYWYHDNNHSNAPSRSSPSAVYNAAHGTWLWPPANARR